MGTGSARISRLGDYISNRTGVCRHQSVLLAASLRKMGIKDARVVSGLVAVMDHADAPKDTTGHAWVEFSLGQQLYLIDPLNNIPATPIQRSGDLIDISVQDGDRQIKARFAPYQMLGETDESLKPITSDNLQTLKSKK